RRLIVTPPNIHPIILRKMRQSVADNPLEMPSVSEVAELKTALRQLQARVDRQSFVIQALKDMMLSANKSTDAEVLDRIAQIASERGDTRTCKKCGKAMNPKNPRCMYCGEAKPADLF